MKRSAFLAIFLFLVCRLSSAAAGDLTVTAIDFHKAPDGMERFCVSFNAPCEPEVFVLPGKRPRIVIDVPGIESWSGVSERPLDGRLARTLRLHLHRDAHRLRMVLDLNPALDYQADQKFDGEEKAYCLEIREDAAAKPR